MSVPTKPPNFRELNWAAIVRQAAGDEAHTPDVGYVFDRLRQFNDSGPDSGIYQGTGA